MEEHTKIRLQEIMIALERLQSTINELKVERDNLMEEFREMLPAERIMKIVK